MTITNGYATLAEYKAQFFPTDQSDTADDATIELVIEAASRAIDDHCFRRFYKNTVDETRYYSAEFDNILFVDDLVSITTLKTDEDGDRTYEQTWVATDYDLQPFNASLKSEPYGWIETTPNGSYSFPNTAKGVQIVGVFGWPSTPKQIKEACLLQAHRLFKRKDAPFGVAGTGELGQVVMINKLDPDVLSLLSPWVLVI